MDKVCKTCGGFDICIMGHAGRTAECPEWRPGKSEPETNADRIRAMSDEELAKWMAKCNAYGERAEAGQWLPWLREPAEGGLI